MKIDEAAALIHIPLVERDRPQSWCDLGSGRGTFTRALAQHLAPGSTVYAVDFDASALEGIPDRYKDVEIRKIVGDVESPTLRLPAADGVLMANMLHFIREQRSLLRRLLTVTDRFLVVEYERIRPHRWGPYPVGFDKLCQLFREIGVEDVEKLATRPSLFGGTMYSALASKSVGQKLFHDLEGQLRLGLFRL